MNRLLNTTLSPVRSFNVLVKELQGLCLRVDLVDEHTNNIDAENLIATSGPDDKTIPANDDDNETYLDESDGIGNIDDGMSVRDIDDNGQISEDEDDYNDNEEEEA